VFPESVEVIYKRSKISNEEEEKLWDNLVNSINKNLWVSSLFVTIFKSVQLFWMDPLLYELLGIGGGEYPTTNKVLPCTMNQSYHVIDGRRDQTADS